MARRVFCALSGILLGGVLVLASGALGPPAPSFAADAANPPMPGSGGRSLPRTAGPSVTGVFPAAGPATGGTNVVVTGSGFSTTSGATTVDFGLLPATSVTCPSSTECIATSPAGSAGTVDITVTAASQTSSTSVADQFSYGNPCPNGSWVGLPYLNRFYTGALNGSACAITVGGASLPGSLGLPATLEVPAGTTVSMEAQLDLGSGSSGSLTLDAGVTLTVSCCVLNVDAQGALTAAGTTQQPVVVTAAGVTPGPGAWTGIAFQSGSQGALDHVQVADAGGGGVPSISLTGAGPFRVTNATVTAGNGDGIDICGSPTTLTNDTFNGNAGHAVFFTCLPGSGGQESLSGLSGSGNGTDGIGFAQNCCFGTDLNGNWSLAGGTLPFIFDARGTTVHAGAVVTLGAGATLEFFGGLSIGDGSNQPAATLNATGAAAAPVVITTKSATPGPGAWPGVNFVGGGTGTLDHVQISDGGNGEADLNAGCNTGCGSFTLTNSTISSSSSDGVDICGGGSTLNNDTFTNNAGFAVLYTCVPGNIAKSDLSGLSGSGNGTNAIAFTQGCCFTTDINGSWDLEASAGLPFYFGGSVDVHAAASLTLGAGATMKVGRGITVGDGANQPTATFNAMGSAAAPVTLTSTLASPGPGAWNGIDYTGGGMGTLDHVQISDGGNGALNNNCNSTGCGSFTLTNSTISNSSGDAIQLCGDAATLSNDSFTNNAGNAVFYTCTPGTLGQDLSGLSATGNGTNAVVMNGGCCGSASIAGAWSVNNLGIPLEFQGHAEIIAGGSLSLGPGSTVLMTGGHELTVDGPSGSQPAGSLVANGVAAAPVTVTSATDSCCWYGIHFNGGSTGALDHTELSLGGSGGASIFVDGGAAPTITNSIIMNSGGDDVRASGGLPVIHTTSLGAVPSGSFGVNNSGWRSGQPEVDATNDDWGSDSGPSGAASGNGTPVSTGVYYAPWTVAPGGSGTVSGTVLLGSTPPGPLPGAQIQVCNLADTDCRGGPVDPNGQYSVGGLPVGQYLVSANPPLTTNGLPAESSMSITTPGQSVSLDLTLPEIGTVPAGFSVTGQGARRVNAQGLPVVYMGQPFVITVVAPADYQSVTYSIYDAAGNVVQTGPLTKDPSGATPVRSAPRATGSDDVNWSGIAAAYDHGNGNLGVTGKGPDGALHGILDALGIYIDPSGTVQTPGGQPVVGATVTLARSDSPSGPFVTVPNGSAIMSPGNQTNPDTTDSLGRFGWDTLAGYYTISATKAGCANTGTTGVLPVPPPQDGLVITLDCPAGTPGPVADTVSPPGGAVIGAASVSLSGEHFQSGATLSIGGQPATNSSASADGTTITATTPPYGDIGDLTGTGGVSATDALCILRAVAQLPPTQACPQPPSYAQADVTVTNPDGQHQTLSGAYFYLDLTDINGDGVTNATDALCLLRHVAQLPGTTACPAFTNTTPPAVQAAAGTVGAAGGSQAGAGGRRSGGSGAVAGSGTAAAPAGTAAVSLTPNDAATTYTLAADAGSTGLGSWTIDVTYDPNVMQVKECTGASGSLCNPSAEPGVVRITGASAGGLKGQQTLATIRFDHAARGAHAPAMRVVTLTDPAGKPLAAQHAP